VQGATIVTGNHRSHNPAAWLRPRHRVVKGAFQGVEQDIEGVVSQGKVWVVQSRPQVMDSK